MMQTGYYARHADHPNAVAISVGVPWWFGGRRYPQLAPKREWLSLPEEAYRDEFAAKLRGMDAHKVVADLGADAVLLCWEAPGKFCHRRLVAEWIERETGIVVAEAPIEEAQWRRQVAVDKLDELAAKGPSPLLCGPDPMECHGRVEIDGFTLECPLRGEC